jgi:hypothetical protein
MKKQAAIPMSKVLEALAAEAAKPKLIAKRLTDEPVKEVARRIVKAIAMPEGFISRGLPPELGAGARPAKAKIGLLAKLFEEMEKGSEAAAYLCGFVEKIAQAPAPVKPDLGRQFLDVVPPDPKGGQKAYEQLLRAGGIGIRDIGLKDVSKLDPKRRAAMEEAAKNNLAGVAGIEDFMAAKNPYGKWRSPVRYRAFPKVQKGYPAIVADFVKKNPELIKKFIAERQAAKGANK